MTQTLSKQGGRRYGSIGLGQGLVGWLRSVGAAIGPSFNPQWALNATSFVGGVYPDVLQR